MNDWKIVVWCIQLSHTFLKGQVASGLLEAEGHCTRFRLHLSGTPISDREEGADRLREDSEWTDQPLIAVYQIDLRRAKPAGQSDKPLVRLLLTKPAADTWHRDNLWKPPGAPAGPGSGAASLRARSTGHTDLRRASSQAACGNRIRTSALCGCSPLLPRTLKIRS